MDLAKTRLQLVTMQNPGANPGISGVISGILKESGPKGLYAGLSASLLRQASYGSARIGLFGTISAKAKERFNGEPLPFWAKTASGMLAGALAVFVGTPCDVCLVRMQADTMAPVAERRNYNGVFDALRRIATEEGVRAASCGWWRGVAVHDACLTSPRRVCCAVRRLAPSSGA